MKKNLSFIVVSMIAISIVGCGSSGNSNNSVTDINRSGPALYTISGTVATGWGWSGARVCAKNDTLESSFDCVITDARGGFVMPLWIQPPWHFRAETTIGDVKLNMGSLSYEEGSAVTVNITPITDVITRVLAHDDTGDSSDASVWKNLLSGKKERVLRIIAGIKNMFGSLDDGVDPMNTSFEPNPDTSAHDRLLEDTELVLNGGSVTLSSVNNEVLATVPIDNIINNSVSGDAQTVTQTEANTARIQGDNKRLAAANNCVFPNFLQNGECVSQVAPTCISPNILQNGECVAPTTPTCVSPNILQNGECVAPATTPTSKVGGVCGNNPDLFLYNGYCVYGFCWTPAFGCSPLDDMFGSKKGAEDYCELVSFGRGLKLTEDCR